MVAVVVALVPAVWFTAQRVFDSSSGSPRSGPSDLPIPPVSPSATTTGTTPSATPTPTPTAPAAPAHLPSVAPDAPRRIVSGRLIDTGFDSAVTTIEPASTSEVARWESRGSPGSPGTDTVYVIGTVAGRDSAFANLPRLGVGSRVVIRTDTGTLTYTVRTSGLAPVAGLTRDPAFTAHRKGWLVLVGIRYDASGNRRPAALVLTAQLTAAKRA